MNGRSITFDTENSLGCGFEYWNSSVFFKDIAPREISSQSCTGFKKVPLSILEGGKDLIKFYILSDENSLIDHDLEDITSGEKLSSIMGLPSDFVQIVKQASILIGPSLNLHKADISRFKVVELLPSTLFNAEGVYWWPFRIQRYYRRESEVVSKSECHLLFYDNQLEITFIRSKARWTLVVSGLEYIRYFLKVILEGIFYTCNSNHEKMQYLKEVIAPC